MLGHLNHATMLNFLERARWALLEPQIDIRQWAKQPVFSVVRHVDIDYLAQSLPGEDLLIRSGLLAVRNTSYILAIELLAACQAIDLIDGAAKLASVTRAVHAFVRETISTLKEDRYMSDDIEAAAALIRSGALAALVEEAA